MKVYILCYADKEAIFEQEFQKELVRNLMKIKNISKTNTTASIILIRIIVGSVFLSEGIQKFLSLDALGVGRFIKIGIPAPGFFAPLNCFRVFVANWFVYENCIDSSNNKHKRCHYFHQDPNSHQPGFLENGT